MQAVGRTSWSAFFSNVGRGKKADQEVRPTELSPRADIQLSQKRHHGAPVRERGLQQVQSHESCEQEPRRVYPVPQGHAGHHEKPGDQSEIAFDCHAAFLFRFTTKYTIGTVMRERASEATSPAIRSEER